MEHVQNVTGFKRTLFELRVSLKIFTHYLPQVLSGKIKPREFVYFLKRLDLINGLVKNNKFVKIGQTVRTGFYHPAFPTKASFTACDKFLDFGERTPCLTVLISVTSACKFRCQHCYQKEDKGKDLDLDQLIDVVRNLQNRGIASFYIEGGDPFLVYDRLKAVVAAIDDRSEIFVNTNGTLMTVERLRELKQLGMTGIIFSMHSHDAKKLNQFMGRDDAWDTMAEGVAMCHQADIPVAFNMCLMKPAFYDGSFEAILDTAKDFGAFMIQIIHPKECGAWLGQDKDAFTRDDIAHVKRLVTKYNFHKDYIDYPSISAQVVEEDKEVNGCTAGGVDRFYVNAKGDVQPCEFLNISFGNVKDESFDLIYERMRERFRTPGQCWLCSSYNQQIAKEYEDHDLKVLPLPPELSIPIVEKWEKGEPTPFYQKLDELKPKVRAEK